MIKLIASFGFIWQAVSPVNVSTSYQKVEKKFRVKLGQKIMCGIEKLQYLDEKELHISYFMNKIRKKIRTFLGRVRVEK